MKQLPILLACVVVGVSIAVGIGLARHSNDDEKTPEQNAAGPVQADPQSADRSPTSNQFAGIWGKADKEPSAPEKSAIVDDLFARALTPAEKSQPGDDAQDKLRKLAQSDPDVMKGLIGRYGREADPNAKELIRSLLGTIGKPEVLAFSKQLATSGDAQQRMEGLALLQNFPSNSQEVRDVIMQTLANERTPSVIVKALAALNPNPQDASSAASPVESAAIVSQLKNLTQNADPGVRSQSLLQLAQWDKSAASQDSMTHALTDPAQEVRQAAIFAIAQSGVQTDTAKTALLNAVGNVNESREVRGSALQALASFKLSKDEAAKLGQMQSQLLDQ